MNHTISPFIELTFRQHIDAIRRTTTVYLEENEFRKHNSIRDFPRRLLSGKSRNTTCIVAKAIRVNFHRRKNNSKAQNKFPTPNFRWVHPDHTLVRACILHYVAYKICVYIRNFIHTYTHKRNKSHGIFSGDFHNLRAHCGGGVFRLGGSEILLHIFPKFSRLHFYF